MTATDTSTAARAVQRTLIRAMRPEDRVRRAAEMAEDARAITMSGIRARHPDWSDARVRRELLVRIYGASLARRAVGTPAGP